MTTEILQWQVKCDREVFEKCRSDERFAYIVALSRAVNSLYFVHSAMEDAGESNAPAAMRGRLNSYFFASAILYEGLKLVRGMNKPFRNDEKFQNGLRALLRDGYARKLERMHLDPVRNGAVFHFLPERFMKTVRSATSNECLFISAHGRKNKHVYYSFADVVTAEILVGFASDSDEFYVALTNAMSGTRKLLVRFAKNAEDLILYHLKAWGFQLTKDSSNENLQLEKYSQTSSAR